VVINEGQLRMSHQRPGGLRFAAGIVMLWLAAFVGVLYALHWWASPTWNVMATAAS
jgi:hypothetical protein